MLKAEVFREEATNEKKMLLTGYWKMWGTKG